MLIVLGQIRDFGWAGVSWLLTGPGGDGGMPDARSWLPWRSPAQAAPACLTSFVYSLYRFLRCRPWHMAAGSAAGAVYEEFAMSFNANEIALATAQFAGQHHNFTWWDPSDPSGQTQVRAQLYDHFQQMYGLGVRLPATATFVAADDGGLGGL